MMKLSRTENIIFWACAGTFFLFLYFLYDDSLFFNSSEQTKNKDIGTFNISNNDVRRKSEESFLWIPATKSDKVYLRDSIFTGDSSNATLKFADGSVIEVKENSMITLNMNQGQIQLDLRYGDLITDIKEKSQIEVTAGTQKFDLKTQNAQPSKVQIQKSRTKRINVKLIEGQAQLTNKKNNEKLSLVKEKQVIVTPSAANNETKIVEVPVAKPVINLLVEDKKPITLFEKSEPFNLSWESKDTQSFKVEISTQSQFSSKVFEINTNLNTESIKAQFNPGWYFWRVTGYDQNKKEITKSEVRRLFITYADSPKFTLPNQNHAFSFETSPPAAAFTSEIDLSWTSRYQYPTYEVQVADNEKFDNPILSSQYNLSSTKSPPLKAGKYFARIRGLTNDNKKSLWSETLYWVISVTEKKSLALELINKKINFNPMQAARGPSSVTVPVISWKKYPNTKTYLVEISKSQDFNNKFTQETQTTQLKWQKYGLGNYYYRVSAKDEKTKQILATSEIGSIKVVVSNPELKPIAKISIKSDKAGTAAPNKVIPVTWTSVPFATKYILELDKDPSFKKPVKQEINTNKAELNITEPGKYHARVIAQDATQPITGYSNTESIEYSYSARLAPPEAEEPRDKVNIFLQQDIEPLIWLVWVKEVKAIGYEVEVATDAKFKKLLLKDKTKDARFLIKNKVPMGSIYWRVKAISQNPNESSDWSPARVFTLLTKTNENFFQ